MSARLNFQFFAGFINAREQALSLFVLRQVEEELDDPGAVAMEMLLQAHDGTIPLRPKGLLVEQFIRKPLAAKNLRMHANDEHLLIVGTIEDAIRRVPADGRSCAKENRASAPRHSVV